MIPVRKRREAKEQLTLYMNSIRVGLLERPPSAALTFTYSVSWLDREHPFPISRQLPLQELPFTGKTVRDFFDNLLPDDRRIKEKLASQTHAQSTQSFDLLSVLGRDCVGALQFLPPQIEPEKLTIAKGRPISDPEIAALLRNLRITPLGIHSNSDFRFSLAGVQNKTALLWNGKQWMIPEGSTPTTHILKPAIGKNQDGPDFSLSVENEWLCLKILKAYGLEVAEAEIIPFDDIKVLSVKRFDREWSQKRLFRIPQEDLCQALGVGPENKYEADGGPGISDILSLLNESDRRDQDRKTFMKSQLLYWLLGAIDGHAKNFSIFIRPSGFFLAPLYDVMSADPHINPKTLPLEKIKLAMAVGDHRHYKIKEILPRHWEQVAAKNKFSEMNELIGEIGNQTENVIGKVSAELPSKFPKKVSDPLFQAMRRRAKIFREN